MEYMPRQIEFARLLATQNGFHCTDWLAAVDDSKELNNMTNLKVNFILEQGKKAQRWRYSSTLSLTSALKGVGGRQHASATLTPW
jgi:hypothetical protein